MKQIIYIIALCCSTLFLACDSGEASFMPPHEKVRVDLNGRLQPTGVTTRGENDEARGEGMINPIPDSNGIPPSQLKVGIVTIEFGSFDNDTPPTVAEWDNPTTYLDYGFFGGQVPDDKPDYYDGNDLVGDFDDPERALTGSWTGNIEYTNRKGDAIQQVFYDEMGIYYYLVVVYPYDFIYDIENVEEEVNGTMIMNNTGASVVFEVDGSQDIMASTMGAGNIEHPFTSSLTFSHKLTALRCYFVAESELAVTRYGDILSVELMDQPRRIGLNIGKQADAEKYDDELFDAYPSLKKTNYLPVRPADVSQDAALTLSITSAEFGYMLAMSAENYTFRITTTVRGEDNPLYVTYTFPAGDLPAAGKAYNLTFTLLETADIVLEAAEAEKKGFEQTFD